MGNVVSGAGFSIAAEVRQLWGWSIQSASIGQLRERATSVHASADNPHVGSGGSRNREPRTQGKKKLLAKTILHPLHVLGVSIVPGVSLEATVES